MKVLFKSFAGVLFLLVALSGFGQIPLVNHGDSWRYRKGTNAPQPDWKTITDAGLNASWLMGNGGFGYADNATETQLCQTLLTDMAGNYRTVYMRRSFDVNSALDPTLHLQLAMDFDDGFIAWLDGVYLTNRFVNSAPNEPAFNATASASHESSRGNNSPQSAETYDLGEVGSRLPVGTHVLAIIGLNQSLSSSDLIQIADLFVAPPPVPVTNTWRLADSPIIVPTNITVGYLSALIIEAGVTVQFGSGVNLTIANGGTLLAEGTEQSSILFTRSGTIGSWGHIVFNGAVGSPESRVTHAHFALYSGSPCLQVSGGAVFFDHLTFGNTAVSYIHVDGASFVIQDCVFPSATARFELVHGVSGVRSDGHGIFLRNFFGVPIGYNDVVDFTGGNRPGPLVHFLHNVFAGASDDILDLDGTDAWVEGNIFLHSHKNGSPDTSSAVSGSDDSGSTSEITVIGNLAFDCDHFVMGKGRNFYTIINNTVVHQSHQGGTDTDGAVVCLADEGFSEAAGMYLEGNIIYDAEKLLRFHTNSIVTFTNNIIATNATWTTNLLWTGPGGNNSTNDPLLAHVPELSETMFTTWAEAQILRTWLRPQSGSPAIGTGPNGRDKGGDIPFGASISGEPASITTDSNATLVVGIKRTGSGIPAGAAQWPEGAGYTHYRWRLDTNLWSAETPISTPIVLTDLPSGPHYVEVSGKRDSGLYQDDSLFGLTAGITRSRTWTVDGPVRIENISISGDAVHIQFMALAGHGYVIEYRDSLSSGTWQSLAVLDPIGMNHPVDFPDTPPPGTAMRFYRLVAH